MILRYSFVFFLGVSTLHAKTLDDLQKQTNTALYFTIPVASYEIKKQGKCNQSSNCHVAIDLELESTDITVISDRPTRREVTVKTNEFTDYINESAKSDLNFSLSIHQNGKTIPLNFKKQYVWLESAKKKLCFNGVISIPPQSSSLFQKIQQGYSIQGNQSILTVEG